MFFKSIPFFKLCTVPLRPGNVYIQFESDEHKKEGERLFNEVKLIYGKTELNNGLKIIDSKNIDLQLDDKTLNNKLQQVLEKFVLNEKDFLRALNIIAEESLQTGEWLITDNDHLAFRVPSIEFRGPGPTITLNTVQLTLPLMLATYLIRPEDWVREDHKLKGTFYIFLGTTFPDLLENVNEIARESDPKRKNQLMSVLTLFLIPDLSRMVTDYFPQQVEYSHSFGK
jgi:hypothetical protein